MERYEREVESHQLRWSAVHTTEFWKENFRRFEDNDFKLIRLLSEVLRTAVETLTLAVACYDIGEFARFHPHGRL
jgi:V-type H+-transporting ATPase subunit H